MIFPDKNIFNAEIEFPGLNNCFVVVWDEVMFKKLNISQLTHTKRVNNRRGRLKEPTAITFTPMTEGFLTPFVLICWCVHIIPLILTKYDASQQSHLINPHENIWCGYLFFSTFSTTAKDRQNIVYLPDVAISRFLSLNGALSKCFAVVISFIFEYLGWSENKRNYLKLFPVFTLIIVYSNNSICLRHITLTNTTQKGSAKGAKKNSFLWLRMWHLCLVRLYPFHKFCTLN